MMFSRIRTNFFTGMLITIPLVVTFWVMYFIVDKFNLLLLEPITNIFKNWIPVPSIMILAKIMMFVVLLLFLTVIGFAARIIILRNIFGFGERILYRVPMISTIYRAIKEISLAFWVKKNTIFQKVALIEYPREGVYQLGFVTSQTRGEVQKKTDRPVLNIFVPTTPNPTSGMLVIVPEEDVIFLDMSVAEGMKMVISGGAVTPGNIS